MSTWRALFVSAALVVAGCGDDDAVPTDAGTAVDAAPGDAGRPGPCTVDSSTAVQVTGVVANLATMCAPSFAMDYQVCWLDHSDHCTMVNSLGQYMLPGLPNAEIVLRMDKAGEIPRLLSLAPLGCSYNAQIFASPTRPYFDALAGGTGYDATKAYVVTYVQSGRDPGAPIPSACVGLPGFQMTASIPGATIQYMDATGTSLAAGTETTASGIALITVDMAPMLGSTPDTVVITGTRSDTTVACHLNDGHGWTRGDSTSQTVFVQEAPLLAGHITYGWWVSCPLPTP